MFELQMNDDGTAILDAVSVKALKEFQTATNELEGSCKQLEADNEKLLEEEIELEKKITSLEAKVVELEGKQEDEPTEREIELQTKVIELEKKATEREVKLAVAQAESYVDENGMGHSAVFINTIKSIMLYEDTEEIKLEDSNEKTYIRRRLAELLETTPGQIKKEAETKNKEEKNLGEEDQVTSLEVGKKEGKAFWGEE